EQRALSLWQSQARLPAKLKRCIHKTVRESRNAADLLCKFLVVVEPGRQLLRDRDGNWCQSTRLAARRAGDQRLHRSPPGYAADAVGPAVLIRLTPPVFLC